VDSPAQVRRTTFGDFHIFGIKIARHCP
jgi:hypothetical protein